MIVATMAAIKVMVPTDILCSPYVYWLHQPTRMNIRLDLVVIWPLIRITFLAWFIRLMKIRWLEINQ
jgi:hypothetical protein